MIISNAVTAALAAGTNGNVISVEIGELRAQAPQPTRLDTNYRPSRGREELKPSEWTSEPEPMVIPISASIYGTGSN